MLCDLTNKSHCTDKTLKILSDGWTNHQNNSNNLAMTDSTPVISQIATSAMVISLTILVINRIFLWITKYKLQYLFRISFIVFIYNTVTLCIPIDLCIISLFIPKYQESVVLSLLHQKYALWILSCTFCFIMGVVRYHWALPVNILKDNTKAGFSHLEGLAKLRKQTIRELSGKILRQRDPGQLNPVYVNGWIPLVESKELAKGKSITATAVGYKFCVYRGENGQAFVIDAYCPHMGADFSTGGKVIGNCIECPFHGWQFSGETGTCTKIPYSKKVPSIAKVKVWESREKNGYVFVWHHAENEPPSWELPSIPEIESGEWVYRGRSEFTVYCHIQEIPENGADIAHLPQVHSRLFTRGCHLENSAAEGHWIKHEWQPQWAPDENEPHVARVNIVQRLLIGGYEVPYSTVNVDIQQIGPATVFLRMDTKFGKGIFLQYITTEGPMLQRVVQMFYTEPKLKPGPSAIMIWGEAVMIERDIGVWNNKKFLKNPLLVAEDKLILKFRRWYSQFYSEHSPTLRDLRQKSLDW